MKNFQIISKQENPLYNRREIEFTVDSEITPSREDIKKLISEKFSSELEATRIKGINGGFGSKTFTINANVYKSREEKENIEHKSKRDQISQSVSVEEPIAEAPAEAVIEQVEPKKEETQEVVIEPVEEKPIGSEPVQEKKEEVVE